MDFFTQDQLFVIFIICLSGIAFVRYRNLGYIKQIFFSAVSYNAVQSVQKSDINNRSLTNFLLSLNFYLSATVFLIGILIKFNFVPTEINKFLFFSIIFVGIILFIYLNSVINYISAYIFNLKEIATDYNKNNQSLYRSLGIILLVINILYYFTAIHSLVIISGIILLIIFYFLRILRFLKINLSKHVNSFYMFLYLCTVEILPLLYLYKISTL